MINWKIAVENITKTYKVGELSPYLLAKLEADREQAEQLDRLNNNLEKMIGGNYLLVKTQSAK